MKKVWLCLGGILVFLMVVLVLLMPLFAIASVFGDMTENTVVQTLPSPDGAYIAQVVDSDQGAMGGNTFVEVFPKGKPKKTQRIYTGSWGEHRSMEIYWKSDTILVINGTEYPIE